MYIIYRGGGGKVVMGSSVGLPKIHAEWCSLENLDLGDILKETYLGVGR